MPLHMIGIPGVPNPAQPNGPALHAAGGSYAVIGTSGSTDIPYSETPLRGASIDGAMRDVACCSGDIGATTREQVHFFGVSATDFKLYYTVWVPEEGGGEWSLNLVNSSDGNDGHPPFGSGECVAATVARPHVGGGLGGYELHVFLIEDDQLDNATIHHLSGVDLSSDQHHLAPPNPGLTTGMDIDCCWTEQFDAIEVVLVQSGKLWRTRWSRPNGNDVPDWVLWDDLSARFGTDVFFERVACTGIGDVLHIVAVGQDRIAYHMTLTRVGGPGALGDVWQASQATAIHNDDPVFDVSVCDGGDDLNIALGTAPPRFAGWAEEPWWWWGTGWDWLSLRPDGLVDQSGDGFGLRDVPLAHDFTPTSFGRIAIDNSSFTDVVVVPEGSGGTQGPFRPSDIWPFSPYRRGR